MPLLNLCTIYDVNVSPCAIIRLFRDGIAKSIYLAIGIDFNTIKGIHSSSLRCYPPRIVNMAAATKIR